MAVSDVEVAGTTWAKAFQVQHPDSAKLGQTLQVNLDELRVRVEEVACQALATESRLVKEVQDLRLLFETQSPSSPNVVDVQAIARTAAATAAYTASREFRQSFSPKNSPSRSAAGDNRDLHIQLRKLAHDFAMEERGRADELMSGLSERVANLEMALEGLLRVSGEREKRLGPPGPVRQYSPALEKDLSGGSVLVATLSAPQGQRESVSPVEVRRVSGSVVISASPAPPQQPAPVLQQSRLREAAAAPAGFNVAPSGASSVAAPAHPGSPPLAPRVGVGRSPSPALAGAAAPCGGGAPRPQQLLRGSPSARSTLPAVRARGGSPLQARAIGYALRGAGTASPPVGLAAASAQAACHPPSRMATPCPAGESSVVRSGGQRSPSPSSRTSVSTQSGAPQPQPMLSAAGAQRPDSRLPAAAPAPLAALATGSASVPLLPGMTAVAAGGGTVVAGGDQAAGMMPLPISSNVQAALAEGAVHLNVAHIERQSSGCLPLRQV